MELLFYVVAITRGEITLSTGTEVPTAGTEKVKQLGFSFPEFSIYQGSLPSLCLQSSWDVVPSVTGFQSETVSKAGLHVCPRE